MKKKITAWCRRWGTWTIVIGSVSLPAYGDQKSSSSTTGSPKLEMGGAVNKAHVKFGEGLLLKMSGSSVDVDIEDDKPNKLNPLQADWRGKSFEEADCKWLGRQTTFRSLRLGGSNLKDDCFTHLKNMHSLIQIDISHTQVTYKVLDVFKAFPHLEVLNVDSIDLSKSDCQPFRELKELRDLDISETRITDKGIDLLTELPKLERLRMTVLELPESACKTLGKMKHVKNLDLWRSKIGDRDVAFVAHLTGLKELHLANTFITDRALPNVAHCQGLENLDLSYNPQITDAGMLNLRELKHLRCLNLGGTGITKKTLKILSNFSDLEELRLQNTAIDDSRLAELQKLKHLRYVLLKGSMVTLKGADQLKQWLPDVKVRLN